MAGSQLQGLREGCCSLCQLALLPQRMAPQVALLRLPSPFGIYVLAASRSPLPVCLHHRILQQSACHGVICRAPSYCACHVLRAGTSLEAVTIPVVMHQQHPNLCGMQSLLLMPDKLSLALAAKLLFMCQIWGCVNTPARPDVPEAACLPAGKPPPGPSSAGFAAAGALTWGWTQTAEPSAWTPQTTLCCCAGP